MRVVDALLPDLHALGLRLTPQRQLIYSLLAEGRNHLTVEAVHEAVLAVLPTVSLRTVYQALHDLEANGEIRLVQNEEPPPGGHEARPPRPPPLHYVRTAPRRRRRHRAGSRATSVKSNEPSERTARRKDRRV